MDSKQIDIEAIFNAAREKRTAAERAAYLDGVCRSDAELRDRVEALLKANNEAGNFLESPPGIERALDNQVLSEGPGTKIGRYKLLELIGEGGFGVVYMAEQAEPIRRKVALKIIKLGMDTKQVIGRFEAERQALALMEHPNIARVLDAGATETGRPYFVMELVRGIPITEYCDKNSLDTQQRLKLFIEVCKAIQHAHQKGIIHRDIKPTNVLITLHDDGTPLAKVIDFGIAKATQKSLTEKTLFTEFKQFVGTPEYMSPEQAQMSALDVDTRSDIYSLGVLLYELLTGTTPFDSEELRSAAYDEMLKTIRETEPPKPSACLHTLGETLTDVAKHRQANPAELCKIVRGDLDWVVMKALEKDRTRRYETANELVMDIERHLADEPVVAGPPSAGYRLRKFIRRNRTGVVFGLSVAVVLVGGIVASTIFSVRAERQAKISQAVADFLRNDVLGSVDPVKARGQEVTVLYILDAAAESIEDKFGVEPLVEASIRVTLGNTYSGLGEYWAGEPHMERALQVRRKQLGEEHPLTLDCISQLGWLLMYQGRLGEAEQLYLKALEGKRRVLGAEHPDTLNTMARLGVMYSWQGRFDEAESLLVKALEISRRVLSEEHPFTLYCMDELGWSYLDDGRLGEAEPLLVKALDNRRRVLGEEDMWTLNSIQHVGVLCSQRGRYDEAERLLVKRLEVGRRVLGEQHPEMWIAMDDLVNLYRNQGHYEKAEKMCRQAIEASEKLVADYPDKLQYRKSLAESYRTLGDVLEKMGRSVDAQQAYKKAQEMEKEAETEDSNE